MSHKRTTELRGQSDKDLKQRLEEQEQAVLDARFAGAGSQERDAHKTRKLRRDIARIRTEIRRRELENHEG